MIEQGWQPAILTGTFNHVKSTVTSRARAKKYPIRVLVREDSYPGQSSRYICGAERFFEIHPEYVRKYWENVTIYTRVFVCEHRIQTD